MSKQLRSGYTTGTHATAVLVGAFCSVFLGEVYDMVQITLPSGEVAHIEITKETTNIFSTIKGDNDDIDVTKGAKIRCQLTSHMPKGLKKQTPTILDIDTHKLYIWAGDGVGVVTKKGLKIAPNFPAINPTPLKMMKENLAEFMGKIKTDSHAVFSVDDGEIIAKDTANAKVGVLGGISILGTRGIVKPVSSSAYIDSIEVEIDVAAEANKDVLVLTLGNSAVDEAKKHYDETNIVEIGNFVYDSLRLVKKHKFKKLVFITSVAKMTKVAQGFKNTHNKFGSIDFSEIKTWLLGMWDLGNEEFLTLKGVLEVLPSTCHDEFITLITNKALDMLVKWSDELGMCIDEIELVTLPKNIVKGYRWSR